MQRYIKAPVSLNGKAAESQLENDDVLQPVYYYHHNIIKDNLTSFISFHFYLFRIMETIFQWAQSQLIYFIP